MTTGFSDSKHLEAENRAVLGRFFEARPMLIGMALAGHVIPGMHRNLVLHAGPPVKWANMVPAMRSAVMGALVYEGLAGTIEEAAALVESGAISFAPAHDHNASGAMTGIITASMPVFIAEENTSGIRAYVTVNEGLGKVLRYGANDAGVIERLCWIRDEFYPLLSQALALTVPLDLKKMVAEALRRGDEAHNRNKSATSQFFRDITPSMLATRAPHEKLEAALGFIARNDHFFLSLSIAHAKATSLYAEALGAGSAVTVMAGNGVEVGIRVGRLGGTWFTAPARVADIKLFPGHTIDEATPTMGDSYITESIGLGAFALAAAPAIASFIGGSVNDLLARSEAMRRITLAEHPDFVIPALDFRGVPCAIDVRKVVETGIVPLINTGIASNKPGVGQIGAGIQQIPLECFQKAAAALEI